MTPSKDLLFLLSARYMLEGTDAEGNACRIFIENQGIVHDKNLPSGIDILSRMEYGKKSLATHRLTVIYRRR